MRTRPSAVLAEAAPSAKVAAARSFAATLPADAQVTARMAVPASRNDVVVLAAVR
jgi:hypothetical protein